MGIVSALLTSPFLLYVSPLAPVAWPALALSLVLHTGYKVSLALIYDDGDLSKAYPLARGMVPLCALPISYFVLGQLPSIWQMLGIAVVSVGVLALAIERSSAVRSTKLILSAIGASGMVAGYSVVDSYGTRLVEWSSFTAWLITLDSLTFLLVGRMLGGPDLWIQIRDAWKSAAVAGALGLCSFAIFIWALSRSPVASVVAFRECSLIFAAIIAVVVLREKISAYRAVAVASIAAGLFLIAFLR
jgi:drug/metabolite transporter (DMT)-like permease